MKMPRIIAPSLALVLGLATSSQAGFATSTFEDQGLAPNSYRNDTSPNPNISSSGLFASGGHSFNNNYTYYAGYGGVWSGWSMSTMTDTSNPNGSIPDYKFEYTSVTGSGANGSSAYAVANTEGNGSPPVSIVNLAPGASPLSVQITNTAYDYYSMTYGDQFATPYSAGNYLLLTIDGYSGTGGNGKDLGQIKFYLANFLGTDPSQYTIVTDWRTLDLSSLQGAQSLVFGLQSNKTNSFGVVTPFEFALDNLVAVTAAVPEPSSFLLCLGGIGIVALASRYSRSRPAPL